MRFSPPPSRLGPPPLSPPTPSLWAPPGGGSGGAGPRGLERVSGAHHPAEAGRRSLQNGGPHSRRGPQAGATHAPCRAFDRSTPVACPLSFGMCAALSALTVIRRRLRRQADLVTLLNYAHFLQTTATVAAHIAPALRDRRELALGACVRLFAPCKMHRTLNRRRALRALFVPNYTSRCQACWMQEH